MQNIQVQLPPEEAVLQMLRGNKFGSFGTGLPAIVEFIGTLKYGSRHDEIVIELERHVEYHTDSQGMCDLVKLTYDRIEADKRGILCDSDMLDASHDQPIGAGPRHFGEMDSPEGTGIFRSPKDVMGL